MSCFCSFSQAAIQLQDRNMHKQLLAMRSSICGLKDELKSERERWDMETQQDEPANEKPCQAYVTQVESVRNNNNRDELRINHVKQDSGILTDEEVSDEELELSVKQMLKTYPPAVRPRSSSFSATAKRSNSYHGHVVKLNESVDKETNDRKPRAVFRARARSVAAIETERLSSSLPSPRRSSQTFADTVRISRFGNMPVINEIPGDALERNTFRSKTFAIYGYRRGSKSVDDDAVAYQSSFSVSKKLPSFGPLTRHGSMPVMHSGGRPKSGTEFRSSKENARIFNNNPIKRSTSQIVLSRPSFEKGKETGSNQIEPYRLYRSTSQISLV